MLSPDVAVLLPSPTTSPKCAPFAASLDVDPAGTAFAAALVVLVEVAEPWPKPINAHPTMTAVMGLMRGAAIPTRILAAQPRRDRDDDTAPGTDVSMVVYRSTADGSAMSRTSFSVTESSLVELVTHLTSGAAPESLAGVTSHVAKAGPAVLVCTQGSHDVCCGELGETFANDAEERFGEVEVFRVSHTGGHRFAPTALTLPDARMWAYLSTDDLAKIFGRLGTPADLANKCRGWIGADRGACQTAERAVFAAEPWAWDDVARTVELIESPTAGDDRWLVRVWSGGRTWHIGVAVTREVPTISCGAPGGLPAKPSREFGIVSFDEVSGS